MFPKPFLKVDPTDLTPRYYQMYLSLRERIKSGEFVLNGMIPTERELCEEYGISRITVIKALDILESEGMIERQQGRGSFVRENIESIQKDKNMDLSVGFVCSDITDHFIASSLVGIAGVLAKNNISLLIFGSVETCDTEVQSIERALARGVNGIIVYPCGDFQNADFFQGLIARGVPIVMTDRFYPDLNVDYVIHDDWMGGFELTTHLIQKGHKKIAFAISDEVLPTSVHDRLAGYKAALEKYGLPYDENLVWVNIVALIHPERKHKTELNLEKVLSDHLFTDSPTGLVAVNFTVAKFLRENIYLRPLEADMPADYMKTIEICSFSDQSKPVYEPYISYLALQPGEPIGIAAAEIMVDRLRKNDPSTLRQIKLPMEIVDMKSLNHNMESIISI